MIVLLITLTLVVGPGVAVYLAIKWWDHAKRYFSIGDPIVYRKAKASVRPGIRAYEVYPSEQGDLYTYVVDKYWTVTDVLADGQIVAVTRTNKQHCLRRDDPNLRKARLTERWRYARRFPSIAEIAA